MSIYLLPISLLIKKLNELPINYLREAPIYLFAFFILLSILSKRKFDLKTIINTKVIISVYLLFGFQLIAMLSSYMEIGNNVLNRNPIKEFIKLSIFVGCIFIHFFTVRLIVSDNNSIYKFIKGNFIALCIVLFISYFQLLYLFFPNIFAGFVGFVGNYFEGRHDREWYELGSYVQTMKRINGLNPESGYLATQLLIIFVPFILSSIKNKVNIFSINRKYNPIVFNILLLLIIGILFAAKSTTGILAILLIVLFFWLSLPIKRKILFTYLILLFGITAVTFIMNNNYTLGILNEYIFEKNEGSTMNRIGGTIGLILTWLSHPITGIGWNYKNYYLFQNVPNWSKENWEYNHIFIPEQYYPILSMLFGWLAEFGTILVILLLIYIYRLLNDFRKIERIARITTIIDKNDYKLICVLKDSLYFFVLYYFICLFVSFDWYESIYLIMFFFFVVVRQYYKKIFYSQK